MAKFIYGRNVSLDGYVDHDRFGPGPALFQHWIDQVRRVKASIYGRKVYELMQYWDADQLGWGDAEQAFASAWRAQHKWVVSRTLGSVGPNALLISTDVDDTIRDLKACLQGDVDVSGTILAQRLTELGLIDQYRLYFHPVVLGKGKPFFAGPRPPLRLIASDKIDNQVIRLTYIPAETPA